MPVRPRFELRPNENLQGGPLHILGLGFALDRGLKFIARVFEASEHPFRSGYITFGINGHFRGRELFKAFNNLCPARTATIWALGGR